ncbi:MAG: hypothetical protein N838_20425 [Thiohalocapsa sp. PB-PSB1]|nr:MAG: hypothetical protein N838_20425 [Thiohalocapsa sp. PB-PSB1]
MPDLGSSRYETPIAFQVRFFRTRQPCYGRGCDRPRLVSALEQIADLQS